MIPNKVRNKKKTDWLFNPKNISIIRQQNNRQPSTPSAQTTSHTTITTLRSIPWADYPKNKLQKIRKLHLLLQGTSLNNHFLLKNRHQLTKSNLIKLTIKLLIMLKRINCLRLTILQLRLRKLSKDCITIMIGINNSTAWILFEGLLKIIKSLFSSFIKIFLLSCLKF